MSSNSSGLVLATKVTRLIDQLRCFDRVITCKVDSEADGTTKKEFALAFTVIGVEKEQIARATCGICWKVCPNVKENLFWPG